MLGSPRPGQGKLFAAVAALVGLSAVAAGCGGCNDSQLVCDRNGDNCQICDGYGCQPADTSGSGATGAGASATGGSSTGSDGGAGSGGEPGTGGTGGDVVACDPLETTCPCQGNEDCAEAGTLCAGGLCIEGCDFTYQCGAGKVCANGQCLDGCSASQACDAGYACENGVCVIDPANPACTDDEQCTEGQVCKTGLCVSPCTINADCAEGEICDASKGGCIADPTPKPACSDTVACPGQGQQCGPDGYCHYECTSTDQCKTIAEQFIACDAGGGLAKVCLTAEEANPECTQADPCPAGEDCISNECL
jgi:Cys-rich repeat protein